jgi:hypothetical protein
MAKYSAQDAVKALSKISIQDDASAFLHTIEVTGHLISVSESQVELASDNVVLSIPLAAVKYYEVLTESGIADVTLRIARDAQVTILRGSDADELPGVISGLAFREAIRGNIQYFGWCRCACDCDCQCQYCKCDCECVFCPAWTGFGPSGSRRSGTFRR